MSKDTPLKASIENEEVVIRVGIDVLEYAANNLWYSKGEEYRLLVVDKLELARDVVRKLNSDNEIGESPISDLFDDAIIEAYEDGSLAFEDD